MGTEQDNSAIVRRLFERVWNGGDLSAIEDLVDDQFTNFGVQQPGGHAAMRHIVTAWRTAFPDLRFEIQEEIVHDDKVVLRVKLRGTHLGEFPPGVGPARIMGAMPPTGRPVEADQIHIHRVAGGKLVEHAASRNDLLMLAQLGLLSGIKPVSEAAWRTPVTPGPPPDQKTRHHRTWKTRRPHLRPQLTVAPIASVQNRLSYGHPGDLPTALACAQRGVAYLAYAPFGGPSGRPPETALSVARRRGVSVHRILLAWLRAQAPNIVPLAGASRPASISDSAAMLDLTDEDLADLRVG